MIQPNVAAPPRLRTASPQEMLIGSLVISNYTDYLHLTQNKGAIYLYRIDCFTPHHYYIGVSRLPESRLLHHFLENGKRLITPFTKRHGVKRMTVLAVFNTRDEAEAAEWRYFLRKREKDGKRVGGFNELAMLWGMGHA